MMEDKRIVPVILSSGAGARPWQRSSTTAPSQSPTACGERPMLQPKRLPGIDPASFQRPPAISRAENTLLAAPL
jgi:hypothetical protein